MKTIDKIKLSPTSTIKEALQVIDSGAMKIALVLNNEDYLLGSLSDGDIRRGLLNGLSLDDSIESIIFQNPTVCGINDSKEEILKIAVAKKLYCIPIVDENGILVGIEEIDDILKPVSFSNKVVLMAGGLGSRLRPLTDETPKPLLQVGDKPILETIINGFSKYGFTDIVLSVSYKAKMIEDYFGDGSNFGVHIEYVHENKRMGTAGALSLMREKLSEPFFVMNGDLLTNINFQHMLEHHLSNKSVATMGVREYDFQVPYGVVNVEEQNILSIDEKPVQNFFVSGGVYVLSPDVLDVIPDEYYDMPTLFEKLIEGEKKAISFPIKEYWLDIGQMSDFHKANAEYHGIFK
ncbi:MAG: D-glycero-D-manno-heptose 1-phosphate guanosyltransferase [uncultured Sulfurovum sp.]|uniref:D-glycero-D-manno-heptose 1-phosphate guanosyltransferase n=1 Tax=uncultured Sulfurovum sp. TaxID=269237 RepID=A0A6S6UCB0_9BACT|nr:MAG: D-glycero-D-manno-heptose 1-phosphate guanosyltransferase [uncultured Sulfurovum sp.]